MLEIIYTPEQDILDRMSAIESLSNDEIKSQIRQLLDRSAETFKELAARMRLLKDRGVDLSDLRTGLGIWIERIAYGQIRAEVVAAFQVSIFLLNQIARLPVPDQDRLLPSDATVEVAIRQGESFTTLRMKPIALTKAQRYQVFAPDHLRSVEEQVVYLRSQIIPVKPKRVFPGIEVDKRRRCVRIGNREIHAKELADLVRELQ